MTGPDVRVFVQTRGSARATDYAFLGGAPPRPWWRAYREATAFDHPTVLVTSDAERWAAYLSGIPSARLDAVGTVVRYTLVLDGPCAGPDSACATRAVAAWLDDVAAGGAGRVAGTRRPLSAALDARFPSDDVQRWLASEPAPPDGGASDASIAAEVRRRALAALAALPAAPPGPDEPGDWLGAVTDDAARAAFVARVAALVDGAPGRALLLNLVGPADAAALREPDSPVAVLVDGPVPARITRLGEVDAKKAPAPRTATPPVSAGTWPAAAVATAVTVLALVVTVLFLLL